MFLFCLCNDRCLQPLRVSSTVVILKRSFYPLFAGNPLLMREYNITLYRCSIAIFLTIFSFRSTDCDKLIYEKP